MMDISEDDREETEDKRKKPRIMRKHPPFDAIKFVVCGKRGAVATKLPIDDQSP